MWRRGRTRGNGFGNARDRYRPGGPTDYLDSSCGILIAPTSRSEVVVSITHAMLTLAGDAALRTKMDKAGRQRAENDFAWEGKMDSVLNIYKLTLEERSPPAAPNHE